jgi:hypothetical protein
VQPYFKSIQHDLRVKRNKARCLKDLATVCFCTDVEKRAFEGGDESFLVDVEDALVRQVSDMLGVVAR